MYRRKRSYGGFANALQETDSLFGGTLPDAGSSGGTEAPAPFTVRGLNELVNDALTGDDRLQHVLVVGEVSSLKISVSGHWFFTLVQKDGRSTYQLRCVVFSGTAQHKGLTPPQNGKTCLAGGAVNLYTVGGEYRLVVQSLQLTGEGAKAEARERLKRQLYAEGYMDPAVKQAKWKLPVLPERIGLVTSPDGAAVRDIVRVARDRWPGVRLLLYPVQVQGIAAPTQIAEGIRFLNRHHLADVLIVGRGGGSKEDLWAFNEEMVARAVATSKIPVITSIGHSIDMTVADFVALMETATPTDAARLVVPDRNTQAAAIRNQWLRMYHAVRSQLDRVEDRVGRCRRSPYLQRPDKLLELPSERYDRVWERLAHGLPRRVEQLEYRLARSREKLPAALQACLYAAADRWGQVKSRLPEGRQLVEGRERQWQELQRRLQAAMDQQLARDGNRLALQAARLDGVSPLAILGRGYSWTKDATGRLIRSVGQVRWGDTLVTQVGDGTLETVVQDIHRDTLPQPGEQILPARPQAGRRET